MAKKVVKRTAKKTTEISQNINKIKDTAKVLNNQLVETAEVVVEEIKEKGVQLKDEAVVKVKDAINNFDMEKGVNKIKGTAKDMNKYTLDTAGQIIDGVVANGEKWQGVAEKAINGGLKLASKQQDIVFATLETVKEQLQTGTSRFKKLFVAKK